MIISKQGSNSAPRESAAVASATAGVELAADPSIALALGRLYQASFLASDCGRSAVDFAVSVAELQLAGISSPALRWLVEKQLAAHWVLPALSSSHGASHSSSHGSSQNLSQNSQQNPSAGSASRGLQLAADQAWLSEHSWLCLSETGQRLAAAMLEDGRIRETDLRNAETDRGPRLLPIQAVPAAGEWQQSNDRTPSWDPERHELRCGQILVKKFKWRASNQERILAAFEEDGWPARIDDPLPPRSEIDSKRRLGDTIKCLNRNHLVPIIKFIGDGSGQGVIWEFQPDLPRKSK